MISRTISRLRDDERGIALQTIIIMVVLLAIAGTVAAVLLSRAGTETDRLESETDRWSGITNETGCDIAGGTWSTPGQAGGTCGSPGGGTPITVAISDPADYANAGTQAECDALNPPGTFYATEDQNGNGTLDSGEDQNGNSMIDTNLCVQ